ncbi:MAG: hypothetical protein A3K19_11795 [Lentisphaerae bacterium RIFOXYB12_FULL_65_16]|nr:MAG: hypothetical protein A3K18_23265 [Lentisphaerae bacterium RIFOXYA12_64_32]OGV87994.1 MAG: hypothetical protein A3K19_11795 [Lentisphaerae bacterium RIFOXYB12_FULL_65_16]
MIVLIDNREQAPFTFARWPNIEVKPATLFSGDYSLPGLERSIALERKSLADLVTCLASERDRFEHELSRLAGLDFAAVLVEGDFRDLAAGHYRSKLNPRAAVASVAAFSVRHVPILFGGDRDGAELLCVELLAKYATNLVRRYGAAVQAVNRTPADTITATPANAG